MSAGARSLPAFSVALAVADQLARRRGVRGIALTGSLARGDFSPGSDVDLWLLSSRNAREERRVDGVDVSLLSTTPAFARSLEGMLRFEVEDAIVLHDPEGLFRALKRTARERREELRAHVVEASVLVMDALAAASKRARPPLALAALRELVRRGASLAVYARYGWRVPRLRHFHEAFPRSLALSLERALGLPVDTKWRAKLPAARREPPPVPELPLPDDALVERYLASGRAGDAVLAVRQALPPGPSGEATMSRAQAALFRAVHGFDERRPTSVDVRSLRREVEVLLEGCFRGSAVWGRRGAPM